MRLKIAPIPPATMARFRVQGLDDLGQPVERLTAAGGEPLRDVLRRARPGEPLILASYSPFAHQNPYREFGAVFVRAEDSGEAVDYDRLPSADGTDTAYFRGQLALRAYSRDQRIVDARLLAVEQMDEVVEFLFANERTDYVHARFPAYGCFACRIDRAA